jgi:hypothetical protein
VTVPHTVVEASGSEETGADLTVTPPELATITQVPPVSDVVVTNAEPESTDAEASQRTPGENTVAGATPGADGAEDGDGAADGEAGRLDGLADGASDGASGGGEAEALTDSDGAEDGRAECVGPATVFAETQPVSAATAKMAVNVATQSFLSAFVLITACLPVPQTAPGTRWPSRVPTVATHLA